MPPPRIYLSPPHMSPRERELLVEAFDSNWIAPLGPHVDALEGEFAARLGMAGAVAVSSGTAALHLSLHLLGVGPGDEVLTSTLTFAATANAITYCGATPVFLDSDRRTWNMDPDLLQAELRDCDRRGRLPKAVVVVDLYGQCADYGRIEAICARYDVPIVEDAAEALGAWYGDRPAGSFGRAACFSLNGNKIITASVGGLLVSQDAELCRQARHLATQARDPAPHYQHSQIGYNYRMSNLLAAVARGQLQVLEERVAARRRNSSFYQQTLGGCPGITFMPEPDGYRSTRWLTCITVDPDRFGCDREAIRLHLESQNIESRPVWKPLHLQPAFAGCRFRGGAVAEALFRDGLCLPSGSSLSEEDRLRVSDAIRAKAASPFNRADASRGAARRAA
jgi:dTDP-4-amino-4,6-dideoxygalactose transaminase